MKVIATADGYYKRLIKAGETFDVPAGEKASWFKPVKDEPAKKPAE